MSTYSILNKHIQMDWSRDIIGQVRTFYDDRESVKLVDGVQSPNYTSDYVKVIDSNGNVIEGYIPKVNFEITGGFEKEMDYLMHEMHRYLFRSYPEHSNALITLTKAERQSYFNEAEHMLDSFWDTENIPSNSELEDFYLKHKFLTNITVARKYCGSSKEEDILIHLFGVPATFTGARTFVDDKQDKVVALAAGLIANTDFNKIYRYYTTSKAATSFESDTFANLTADFTSFVRDIVVAKELPTLEGTLFDFAITDDPITPIITNLNNILEYGSVNGSTIKKDGSIDAAGGKRGSISSSMVLSDVISDQIFGKYSANIISDADYADLAFDFNTRVTLGSDDATNVVPYQGSNYNTEIIKACENKFLTREVTFSGLKDAIVLKTGKVCYNKVFVKWFTHLCASELAKAYVDEQNFGVNYSANRRMQYNFDVQFDLIESTSGKPVITGFLNRNLLSSIPESKQFKFDFTNPQDDWLDPKEFFQCLSHPGDCEYINFGNGDMFGLKISFNVWEDQRKDPQGNPIGYVSDVVGNPPTSGVFNPVVLLDYVSSECTESGIPFLPRGTLTTVGSVQFYGLNYLRQIETVPIYFLNKSIYLDDNWMTSINTIELPIEGGFSLYDRIMDLASTTVESKTSDDGKIIYFIRKYALKDEYIANPYEWATSEILNAFAVNTETVIKQIGRSEEVSAQSLAKYNAEMVDETTIRLREDIKDQVMKAGRLEFMLIDAKAQRHFGYLKDSYIKNDYCYCTVGDIYPPLGFADRYVLTCYLYVKGDPIDSREEDHTKFRRKTSVRAAAYDNKYYYETTWGPLSDDNLRWYCDSFTSSKADSYIEQDNNFTTGNELYDPATLTEYESLTLVSCDPNFIKPITDLINENKSLYIDSSIKFVSHIPLIQGTTAHSKEYNTISAMFTDTVPNYITFYDIDIKDFPEFEGFYNATVDPDLKDIHYVETIVNRSLMVWGNSIWDGTADETTKKLRTIWGGYFSNFIVKDLRDYLPDSYTSIHSIGSNSSISIKLDNYNYACNEGEPERRWNLVYSPSGGVNSSVHVQVIDYYSHADHLGKDWKEYRSEQNVEEPEELASILKPTNGKVPVIDMDDTYNLSVEKQLTGGEYKYEIETVPLDFNLKFDWTGRYLYQCRGLLDNQTLGIQDGVRLVTHSTNSNIIQDVKLVDHQIHYEDYWNPPMIFQVRHKPIEAYLGHMLYEYAKESGADSSTELTMSGFTDYLASLTYLPAIAYLEEDKIRLAVFNTTKDTDNLLITVQDFGIPVSMHILTELFGKSCTGFEFENNATMRKVIAALSPTIYNIPNATWTGRLKDAQINLTDATEIGLTEADQNDTSNDKLEVFSDPGINTANRMAIFHKDGDERNDWDIKKKINQSDKVTIEEGKDNAKLIRVEDLMEHSLGKQNPYGVFKFQENNKYFKEFTRESITLSATNNGNEYMDCTIDFGRNEDMEFDGSDEILLYAIRGPLIRSVYAPSKEIQLIERGYAIGNLNVVSYDKTEGGIYLADSSASSLSSVTKAISDLKGIDNSGAELRKFVTDIVNAPTNESLLPKDLTKDTVIAKVCENVYAKNYDNNITLIGETNSESVKNKYIELKTIWLEKIKHQEITVNSAKFGIKWPSPLREIGYTFYKRKFVTEGVVYASEPNKVYINDSAIILRDHIGGGDEVELLFVDSLSKDNPKTQVSLNVDMSNYPGPYKLLAYNAASEQEMSDDGESIPVTTIYAYVGWQRGIAKITIKDTVEVTPYGVDAPLTDDEGGKLQNCSPFTLDGRFYYTCVYTNGNSVTYEAKPGSLSPVKETATLEPGELYPTVMLSSEEEFQKYYSFGLTENDVPSAVDAIGLSRMQIVTDSYGRKIKVTHNSEGNVYELIEDAAYLERFPVAKPKNQLSNSAREDYLDWLGNVFSVDGKLVIPVITPDSLSSNDVLGAEPTTGAVESFAQSDDAKYLAELLFLKDEEGNYCAQGMSVTDALENEYLLAPDIGEVTTGAFTSFGTKKQTVPCITYNEERFVPAETTGDQLEAQNWYNQMLSLLDAQSAMRLHSGSSTFNEGEEWVAIIDKGGCLFTAWNKRTGAWVRLSLQNFLGYSTASSSYPSNYLTDIPVLFNTVTSPDRKIWDDYKEAVVQSTDLQQWIIRNATMEVPDPDSEDGKGTTVEWIAPFSEDTKELEEFNEDMMTAFDKYIDQMNAADRLAPNMLNKLDGESAFSLRKVFTASTQISKSEEKLGIDTAKKLKTFLAEKTTLKNNAANEATKLGLLEAELSSMKTIDETRVAKFTTMQNALMGLSGELQDYKTTQNDDWTLGWSYIQIHGMRDKDGTTDYRFMFNRDTAPVSTSKVLSTDVVLTNEQIDAATELYGKIPDKSAYVAEGGKLKAYLDVISELGVVVRERKDLEEATFGLNKVTPLETNWDRVDSSTEFADSAIFDATLVGGTKTNYEDWWTYYKKSFGLTYVNANPNGVVSQLSSYFDTSKTNTLSRLSSSIASTLLSEREYEKGIADIKTAVDNYQAAEVNEENELRKYQRAKANQMLILTGYSDAVLDFDHWDGPGGLPRASKYLESSYYGWVEDAVGSSDRGLQKAWNDPTGWKTQYQRDVEIAADFLSIIGGHKYTWKRTNSSYQLVQESIAYEDILSHDWNLSTTRGNNFCSSNQKYYFHVMTRDQYNQILASTDSTTRGWIMEGRYQWDGTGSRGPHNCSSANTMFMVGNIARSADWVSTACLVEDAPLYFYTSNQLQQLINERAVDHKAIATAYQNVQQAVSAVFGHDYNHWQFLPTAQCKGFTPNLKTDAVAVFNGRELAIDWRSAYASGISTANDYKTYMSNAYNCYGDYITAVNGLSRLTSTRNEIVGRLNTAAESLFGYNYKQAVNNSEGRTVIARLTTDKAGEQFLNVPTICTDTSPYTVYVNARTDYLNFVKPESDWHKQLVAYRNSFKNYREARNIRRILNYKVFGNTYDQVSYTAGDWGEFSLEIEKNTDANTWWANQQNATDMSMQIDPATAVGSDGMFDVIALDAELKNFAVKGVFEPDPEVDSTDPVASALFTLPNWTNYGLRGAYLNELCKLESKWDPLPYPFPFTNSSGQVVTMAQFYELQGDNARTQQLAIFTDYYSTLGKNDDGSLVDPTKWDMRAKLKATIELSEKVGSDTTGIENYLPSNTSVKLGDLVAIGSELNDARKLARSSGNVHSLINNVGVIVDSEEDVGVAYVYGTVNYNTYTEVSDEIKLNIIASHNNVSTNNTAKIEDFTPIAEATFLLKINLANNEVSAVPMVDGGALIQSIVPTHPGYKVIWRDPSNPKNIYVQEVSDLSKLVNTGNLTNPTDIQFPFVEMNSNPSPDPFKGMEMLLLETLDENLNVEIDEFSFDEDRFKTATVSSIQNRTFEDEGDCIVLRNSSISFNNVLKARAVVLVSDPSRDNFQFPYGSSMNFASQIPEALTIFEVDDAKFADFATTANRFDYDQSSLSRVDLFLNQYSTVGENLAVTKSIYPFITDIDTDGSNVDLLKKFYKLDDNNQPKLMRNDLGRQIIRIVPMGFRLPLTEKDDNGFVRLAAFNSEGFLMRRGEVLNEHYSIYEGNSPNRLFQWDTNHFTYRYLQEDENGETQEISQEVVEGENVVSADAYIQTSMLLGKSYSELMMLTDSNSKAVLFAGVYEMVDNPRQAVLDNPYRTVSADIDAQVSDVAQPNALTIEDNYIRIQMLNNSFVENVVPLIEPDASYRNANERVRPNFEVVNEDFSVTDKSELVNGGIVLMNLSVRVVTKTNSYPRLVPITNYKVNTTGDNTYIDSKSTELYIPAGGYGQTLTGNYTYPENNLFAEGTFFDPNGWTKNKDGDRFNVVDKDTLEVRAGDEGCPKLVYGSFLKADRSLPVKLATKSDQSSYNSVIIPLDGLVLGKHSITFPSANRLPWLAVETVAGSENTIFNFEGTYNLFTSGTTFSCKMIRKNSKVDVKNTTDIASYEDISILSTSGTERTQFSTEELIKHLDYTRLYAGDAVSDLPKYTRYFDAHSRQVRLTGGSLLRDPERRACNSQGLIYKVNNLGQLTTDPVEAGEWAYAVRRDSNSDVYQLENILRDFTYARGADKIRSLYSIPFKFENKTFAIDGNSIAFSVNPNFISVYTYESLKGVGAEFSSIICEDDGSAEVGKEEKYKLNFNTDLSYEFDAIFSTAFTRYNFAVMRDRNNKVVGTVYFGDYIDSDYVMIFSNV